MTANRVAVADCGKTFELDGDLYGHVPAPITVRFECADCSAVSETNPSGLIVSHMVSLPHPEGLEKSSDEPGSQP